LTLKIGLLAFVGSILKTLLQFLNALEWLLAVGEVTVACGEVTLGMLLHLLAGSTSCEFLNFENYDAN